MIREIWGRKNFEDYDYLIFLNGALGVEGATSSFFGFWFSIYFQAFYSELK